MSVRHERVAPRSGRLTEESAGTLSAVDAVAGMRVRGCLSRRTTVWSMPLIRPWNFFRLRQYANPTDRDFPHTLRVMRSGSPRADYVSWDVSSNAVSEANAVPVYIGLWESAGLHIWLYADRPYATADPDLTSDEVDALINEQANRRRIQIERAHALRSMTEQLDVRARRERIPQAVKVAVWQRDGGRCVECESNKELEFDHIIPLAMGGSNTERNLQLLCADCNRRKGATLG